MRKGLKRIALATSIVCALSGCGSSKGYDSAANTSVETAAAEVYDNAEYATEEVASTESLDNVQIQDTQKLIKTVNMNVETKEFESVMDSINSKTTEMGGYIQYSEIYDDTVNNGYRNATLTIRIPADKLESFINVVEENTNVTYKNESVEDITLDYVDVESHINALKVEQEALLKMLESAEELSDIISIQSQLTQVRYEIESYESRKRTYDNKVDYSTIYVSITEVSRETPVDKELTYWGEVSQKFSESIYILAMMFRAFSIWLIVALPYFVVFGLIILIIYKVRKVLIRRTSKGDKKNSKSAMNNDNMSESVLVDDTKSSDKK